MDEQKLLDHKSATALYSYGLAFDEAKTGSVYQTLIKKSFDIIRGNQNQIDGHNNFVIGDFNVIVGDNSTIKGDNCCVKGDNNFIDGNNCRIFGNYNTVKGVNNQVSDFSQSAILEKKESKIDDILEDIKNFSIDDTPTIFDVSSNANFRRKFEGSEEYIENGDYLPLGRAEDHFRPDVPNEDKSFEDLPIEQEIYPHPRLNLIDPNKETDAQNDGKFTSINIIEHIESMLNPKGVTPSPLWVKTNEQGDQVAPPGTPKQFLCCICMNNCVKILLVPCNHICLCICCATKLYNLRIDKKIIVYKEKKSCPICYTKVTNIEKTF